MEWQSSMRAVPYPCIIDSPKASENLIDQSKHLDIARYTVACTKAIGRNEGKIKIYIRMARLVSLRINMGAVRINEKRCAQIC